MAGQLETGHAVPVTHNGAHDKTTAEAAPIRAQGDAQVLADPGPLGLAALALPLVGFSWISIGQVEPTLIPVVLSTLLFYGGLGQFAVAMWEMRKGNTFGVTAFGTFGAFNLAAWYFFSYGLPDIPAKEHPAAMALFLAIWAFPSLILWIASFRTTLVVNLIFMFATALFVFAAIGQGQENETLVKISGWIGIALAIVAWYGCLAALTRETFGRVVFRNPQLGKHA